MGHLSSSFIYKWNIKRISFGIEGGFITYEENIDKPFKEEFLIAISGFIFQILFYLITYFLYSKNLVNSSFMFLVKKYNYSEGAANAFNAAKDGVCSFFKKVFKK